MNNVKASNAVVAVADAMASMVADYEGQVQQLHVANKALTVRWQEERAVAEKTDAVLFKLESLLMGILANPEGRNGQTLESFSHNPKAACQYLLDQLRQAPCLIRESPNPPSPSGAPPTSPTSSAATPSERST